MRNLFLIQIFLLLQLFPNAFTQHVFAQTAVTPTPAAQCSLPDFHYPDSQLKQHWPVLNTGPSLPFPDQDYLQEYFHRYPALLKQTLTAAQQPGHHPSLQSLNEGNLQPLAHALQQVWRLHYQGDFIAAWELGNSLGPVGAVPGLYARMMYATLSVSDSTDKLAILRDAAQRSEQLLPLTPDDAFARFGLIYARARILELLPTTQASSTGYLQSTRDTLLQLIREDPQNALYPATLGGLHAGVVSRVGSFIGSLTYGSTAGKAIAAFEQALLNEAQLPVIYFEYARALGMINAGKYRDQQLALLQKCLQQPVFSAEEALNQCQCQQLLTETIANR
ncbi:MAG: hypothetical protein CMI13_00975 [Oleibacter sp.]|nr:hypothetical protein [Thalassolituus sp.]